MSVRLTPQLINELTAERQAALVQLRPHLSPDFSAKIATKLALEAKDAAALVVADKATEARLSHYTFVLDSQYFDQKFLS